MTVGSDEFRINGQRWADKLERIYDAAEGPAGAAVVLSLIQALYDNMLGLYDKYIHIPLLAGHPWAGQSGRRRRRMTRQFKQWKEDAHAFGERLEMYWSDACLPSDPCPEEAQPQYTNAWVALPVFEGRWPEDYYLGVPTPGRPDAVELAALWNQVVAVKEVYENVGDTPDQMLIEMLERTGAELRTSLPGEPETWRDQIEAALAEAADGLGDMWEGLTEGLKDALWYIGAGLGALVGGWGIYKVATRDK